MRKCVKSIFQYIAITALLMVGYIANILMASAIPVDYVRANLSEAYQVFVKEGLYPNAFGNNLGFYDNFTDVITCNIILNQNNEHIIQSGVANNFVRNEGENVIDAFGRALEEGGTTQPYSNFWLGSILFIKLMLIFFDWGEIRYLIFVLTMILHIALAILLNNKINMRAMLAYLFCIVLFCLPYNSGCIHSATDIILMEISCIIGLLYYDKLKPEIGKGRYEFFFIIGALQFFWSYIYTPMYSLGMLLLFMYLQDNRSISKVGTKLRYVGLETLFWVGGYGVTALSKQVLAKVVLGSQIGTGKLKQWGASTISDRLTAFLKPIKSFDIAPIKFVILALLAVLVLLIILKCIKFTISKENLKNGLIMIAIGATVAYVWFAILCNAVGHAWYCQNLLAFVFSIAYMILGCIKERGRSR